MHPITLLACISAILYVLAGMPDTASAQPFTFIAIGDGGDPGAVLNGNAKHMLENAEAAERNGRPVSLLVFLGDNFYPNGLNLPEERMRRELIDAVLGPHRPLMARLGKENVYSIPGNHEYYCSTINNIPYGSCHMGNVYAAEIPEWTYRMHYPATIRRAVAKGSADSVEIIFFDSALLLTQNIQRWRPVLDSMERTLRISAQAPGVRWRIIATHHSPYSVGEHGGYRVWLSGQQKVGYVGNCYEDLQDPFKYVEQLISHQDNCTPRYSAYSDSLAAVVERSGAKVQLLMAGHDHSLQMLYLPGISCTNCPKVYMVNGAGSKRARVKSPEPPHVFSHPVNNATERGKSLGGFTLCSFDGDALTVRFINSADGKAVDMGGGATTFVIDQAGRMATR